MRRGILIKFDPFPLPKTDLTPIEKTPNPAILRALISVSRQNGLRFCENEALFDRKLLEYLHEQGGPFHAGKSRTPGDGPGPEMIYSGSVAGSFCSFSDPVFCRVSTVRENTVLTDYFSKITDLQAICPCSLAGSG